MDEFFPDTTSPTNIDRHRKEYLWNIYFSGGQIEMILDDLLKVEDFRKYESLWRYMAIARGVMTDQIPFWEMESQDRLLLSEATYQGKNNLVEGQVFAKVGEVYASISRMHRRQERLTSAICRPGFAYPGSIRAPVNSRARK